METVSNPIRGELAPLVTIVTVVYNAESFLEKTIQSVLSQTYSNIEYLIIDGGSKDGTLDIIKRYETSIDRWISEPDKGIYDAMNKGIKLASDGGYITFLNAGDFYCNERVVEELFSNLYDSFDVVYGDTLVIESEDSVDYIYAEAKDFTADNLFRFSTAVVCHQAIFVKKSRCPLYNSKLKFKGELNWYFDLVDKNANLAYKHKRMPVVYYTLGGFGDKYYWRNNLERIKVLVTRYGIRPLIQYNIFKQLILLVRSRYNNGIFRFFVKIYRALRKALFALLHPLRLGKILNVGLRGYLKEKNWENSYSISRKLLKGTFPSFTYSFANFLYSLNRTNLDILEINGIDSDVFFAELLNKIGSCKTIFTNSKYSQIANEIVQKRFKDVNSRQGIFDNKLKFIQDGEALYDIIVLSELSIVSANFLKLLKKSGIIVYNAGNERKLLDKVNDFGFKRLEFSGLSPTSYKESYTVLFYKEENCLGI